MRELLPYNKVLKPYSRELRKQMTKYERILWSKLRRKQISGIQFYTQKPVGPYILDFFANYPRLAIELDGEYHFTAEQQKKDVNREIYLEGLGIKVLRFRNIEVQQQCHKVILEIKTVIEALLD